MRRTLVITLLAVVLALLVSLAPVRGVHAILGGERKVAAKRDCSNSSLRGSYGLHATGTIPSGPFAAVGIFSFDGAGNLTGTLFQRVTGNTSVSTLTGTYTVNPDCTVSDTWNFSDGSSSQHESVIVDGGRGYFILNTTAGAPNVVSGEAREQFPGHSED